VVLRIIFFILFVEGWKYPHNFRKCCGGIFWCFQEHSMW